MLHDYPTTSMAVSREHVSTPVAVLLQHIERSLNALISVAEQITQPSIPRHTIPLLFERIDVNARRAEETMRELRDYSIARSTPGTELSQSLTVVLLVADMVVSGHLPPIALGDADVFRRNTVRALACLEDLRRDVDF